jgi:cobalt-zinc-cadmium efflux system protein
MAHSELHSHGEDDRHPGHGRSAAPSRGLGLSLALVLSFGLVEIATGWFSGSLALLADGLHMLTDALALALAWGAQWLARRPPDAAHTFGYERVESLAAFVNALFYLGLIAWIVVEAIGRFSDPPPIVFGAAMPVAVAGLLVNAIAWWLLHRDSHDLNIRGALLHVMGDFAASLAAIIAIGVAAYTGWLLIDPLLTLLISALLLLSSLRLLADSARVLMNAAPGNLHPADIAAALRAIPGVLDVHDLHVWSMSSGQPALAAHLGVVSLVEWPAVLAAARERLVAEFGIEHITLQPEPRDPSTSDAAARPI